MLLLDLALCALAQPAVALQTEWRVGPLESCLATAQATQKPVLVYFWLEGSDYCAKLWGETLTAEGVQPELGEFELTGSPRPEDAERLRRLLADTQEAMQALALRRAEIQQELDHTTRLRTAGAGYLRYQ